MKLARMYTGKPGFISCIRGFHGKSYGSLSLMGKGEYRLAFEPLLAGRVLRPLRRRGRRRGRAGQGGGGRHGHRGGGGGARAGRGRSDRSSSRLLAAPPRGVHQARRPAHRRRGADGHGAHGTDVRGGPLGRGPRHPVPGQGAGRRRDAAVRLHVHPRDLEGAGAEPVHPLFDLRRQPAGLRGRHRRRQRDPRRGPARSGGRHRGVLPDRAACFAGALRRSHRGGPRAGAPHRARVRRRRVRLLGGGRPLPPRGAGRGHAPEREDHPAGAGVEHPARAVDEVLEKLEDTLRELTS